MNKTPATFLPPEAATGFLPPLPARIVAGHLLGGFARPLDGGETFPPEKDPSALLAKLLALTPIVAYPSPEDPMRYFPGGLSSDYGPSDDLRGIADAAGVECRWAMKFHVFFSLPSVDRANAYVGLRDGHGAPPEYYCPVSDGRVLAGSKPWPRTNPAPAQPGDLGTIPAGDLPEDGSAPDGMEFADWNWQTLAAQLGIPLE